MKKAVFSILAVMILFLTACSKSDQHVTVSQQQFTSGTDVQSGDTLNSKNGSSNRAIAGTLKAGQTYYLSSDHGDATINTGDTLTIQSGVTIYIIGPSTGQTSIGTQDHAPGIVVNGTLLSLGTKDAPILVTVQDPALRSNPALDPQNPSTDPAFKGYWGGIQGGTQSGNVILKWTRLEYLGGLTPSNAPVRATLQRYGVWMQNPNANLVVEDCWLYGSANDCLRPAGCKFEILRNTFEKVGITAGECVNVKSGSVGDIAFNVVVGGTGNAFKSANAGGLSPQANMNCYNNTILTTGYRQLKVGEGGSLDFESDGRGNCYNNLLVNCKFGLGITGASSATAAADTANVHYGYTYNYGDSSFITRQFLPAGYITAAQPGDINGGNATVPGANNPMFVGYSLPVVAGINFIEADYAGTYNFRLQPGSPAIGKGYTGFTAYGSVPVDPVFGVTQLSQPGKDMGAYQTDGSGNQH
ncbi:MAG: hypothetical protein P4L51_19670 [Puia sp.]|nr:hypothetical protein [Puia sp.]